MRRVDIPDEPPIILSLLPTRLRADYSGTVPSYNALYRAVVDGRIDATRSNSRWVIEPGNLPEIARTFGLTPKVSVSGLTSA